MSVSLLCYRRDDRPRLSSLTCDGVVMVGSVCEGLQQVSLVLKGVIDPLLKVLKARDEMIQGGLSIGMVQQTPGWDLQPAVGQVRCLTDGRRLPRRDASLQW